MTGRERILSVLRGELPDRVPVCPFVQQDYLSQWYGRNDTCRVRDAVALSDELGFDVFTRDTFHIEPHYLRHSYPNWEVQRSQAVEGGLMRRRLTITTPEGVLTQEEAAPYDPAIIDGIHFQVRQFLLSDLERDFPIFRKYMPAPTEDDRREMRERAQWAEAIVGNRGVNCPWGTGGAYNTACSLRGLENLLCDPYDDEDLYQEFMDWLSDELARDYRMLAETPYPILGLQGNLAGGGVMSLEFFQSYAQPYEEKILKAIAETGTFSLYHNCGYARRLYPAYHGMSMTLLETLSPPPQGDNDFAEAKAALPEKVLAGNLDQVVFLKKATPSEVEAATKALIAIGKPNGHYIFACSDFLERGTPAENVRMMISTAIREGRY